MNLGELLTLAGYLTGCLVLYLAARRRGLATEGMALVAAAGLVGGVVGARLTHWLVVEPGELLAAPAAWLAPGAGGRSILGGIAAGWLAVELAKRRLGITRSTGDAFALAIPAGEAVGRVGCWLHGCCYGRPTTVPWAIWQHGAWRHPTQAYLIAVDLLLLGALGRAARRGLPEGRLFRWFLLGYGAGRLVVECFRAGEPGWLGLSAGQAAAGALAVAGLLGLRGNLRGRVNAERVEGRAA